MPERLASRAGGARFRPGMAPPGHSSWRGRGGPGRARVAPLPRWAPSLPAPRGPAGKTVPPAPPPGGAGSRRPTPGSCLRGRPGVRTPDGPGALTASPAAPRPGPALSGAARTPGSASRSQPVGGRAGPAGPPFNPALLPPAGPRRLPPAPPTPPARTPARQRHPAASRNLTPSSASCAPPRPAANFLRPTSERAGRPDGPQGGRGRHVAPPGRRRSPPTA